MKARQIAPMIHRITMKYSQVKKRTTGSMFTLWTRRIVMASACARVGVLGRTLRLKVRVHGGVFVATNSQIASCESGMPFESL